MGKSKATWLGYHEPADQWADADTATVVIAIVIAVIAVLIVLALFPPVSVLPTAMLIAHA